MKIKRIEIHDFRNIEHIELDIPNAVALFGKVGQGKTSMLEAIRLALLGECELLADELGKRGAGGVRPLVRDGAKEASITVEVDDLTVCLTISNKGKKEWFCYGAGGEMLDSDPKTPAELWPRAGTSIDYARVSMQPGRFLNSTDLGDILAEFLSGDVDAGALRELAGGHADWLDEFAIRKTIRLNSIPMFQSLGDAAYSRRSDVNREIKQTKVDIEAFGHIVAPKDATGTVFAVEDIPAVKDAIPVIKRKLQDLFVEKGRAAGAKTAEEIDTLRRDLNSEHNRLCEVDSDLGAELRTEQEKCEQTTTRATEMGTDLTEEIRKTDALAMEVSGMREQIHSLESPNGECPTCHRKYNAKQKQNAARLRESFDLKIDELTNSKTNVDHLAGIAGKIADELRTITAATSAIREKMAANQTEIASVIKQRDNLPALEPCRPLAEVDAQIEMLEAKLVRGDDALERLDKMERKAEAKYFLSEAEIELDHLTWAVDAFRNGEAIKGLIGNGLSEFTSRCNAELSGIGYEMEIEATGKKVAILLKCPGATDFRPVALCSSGQRALAQAAIAFAFADTGSPVFLDDLNSLDGVLRPWLILRVHERVNSTVIMAAAWQQSVTDMEPVAKALYPVGVVWVEGGAVNARVVG